MSAFLTGNLDELPRRRKMARVRQRGDDILSCDVWVGFKNILHGPVTGETTQDQLDHNSHTRDHRFPRQDAGV
jgi:hypothetical protein